MATTQYNQWLGMGKPYVLIRPAKDHQANIRKHGFTVYDYPDDSHLRSSNPQDHTPFSRTKWPIGGIGVDGKGRAIDIMPKGSSAAAIKELADMARQIIRDKDNKVDGTEAIKYMNWTDEQGVCRNENWKSGKRVTTSSTDKGHTHISYRDDMDNSLSGANYDPVARMHGDSTEDDDMEYVTIARDNTNGQLYACNGMISRPIADADIANIRTLAKEGRLKLVNDGAIRDGWYPAAFGEVYAGGALFQTHAIVRADRWQWDTDEAGFVKAGGDVRIWRYGGGMGANTEAQTLKTIENAVTAPSESNPVDQATVVDALESVEGQAAIAKAVETAGDT